MERAESQGRTDIVPLDPDQLVCPSLLYRGSMLIVVDRTPSGSPTDLMTLHASSLSFFQQTAEIAKVS